MNHQDLQKIEEFGSAIIADAVKIDMEKISNNLDTQILNYTGPEIKSLTPEFGAIAGKIITAEVTTNDPDSNGISWDNYYDLIDKESSPIISIIKDIDTKHGRGASFGDGMAALHKSLGVVGVVIDGTVRDIDGIREIKLPIWGKGLVPGHGAFKLIRVNSQISVGQLLINPSEILIADSDGCTKIPNKHNIKDILKHASNITNKEVKMHQLLNQPGFTYAKFKNWKKSLK